MDDNVRRVLEVLAVARKQLRAHPMPVLAAAGFVVCTAAMFTGARVEAARATNPPVDWLGLLAPGAVGSSVTWPAVGLLTAVIVLVALWIGTTLVVRRRRVSPRQVWWTLLAWAVPFAVGPPLFGTTVYSYIAYGLLQHDGHDPYQVGPAALGTDPIVAAVDPTARAVPSAAGPLGSVLQHAAVTASNTNVLGALIILRVVGVLSVIWIGRLAAELAPRRAALAIALTALSPPALLYVVSAARLDGLAIGLLLAALAAARRGRWLIAVGATALAGCVLPQMLVAVPFVIAVHAIGRATTIDLAGRMKRAGVDVALAAAVISAAGFAQPDGFGWIRATAHQFGTRTPFAAASVIGEVLAPVVRASSYDDRFASGAVTALTAALCVIGYLLGTVRRRPLARSIGYALLAAALLGLLLQPWYLLWGTVVLAPTATGVRRRWVVALVAVSAVLSPQGFVPSVAAHVTASLLGAAAVAAAATIVWRRSRSARERDEAGAARRHRRDVAGLRHLRWPGRRDLDRPQDGLEHGDCLDHGEGGAEAAPDPAPERDPRGRRRVLP
jgi:alpha-1,6-mannosyltransferase